MRLNVTDNADKAERDLSALYERIVSTALPRTINALLGSAQTAGFRQIAQTYQIPARTMEQYASQQLASAANLEASITVKGKGLPLSMFNPRSGPQGVTVTIKGRDVLFPHSFMVPGRFGLNVFARGAYGGKGVSRPTGESFGRFVFDRGGVGARHGLPINKFYTFAPPDAFDNPVTVQAMQDNTAERAPAQLQRELSAVVRGF